MQAQVISTRIAAITRESRSVLSFELIPVAAHTYVPFTAGAHIDLLLPNGLLRSYSLVNPQSDTGRYVVAVHADAHSRGGSRTMHESIQVGTTLDIHAPHNNFPLTETASHSVFVAGGIGITPLWCMIQQLDALGRTWEIHYCAKSREDAAFVETLEALAARGKGIVHRHFKRAPDGNRLDLRTIPATLAPGTHVYCCGPTSMLESFEQAMTGWPEDQVHLEYFSPKEAPAKSAGVTVVLARSGKELQIAEGQTILDAILDAGVDLPYACMEGSCGTCAVNILEGIADHRDIYLTKAEREQNDVLMVCCSGSKSVRLVLDI